MDTLVIFWGGIDIVLQGYLNEFIIVYFSNIIIYLNNEKDYKNYIKDFIINKC